MWPEPTDTRRLLEQAREGHAPAVDELLDRHRDALRRVVHLRMDRLLQRRVDASDIVQDVLLDASRRLGDYLRDPSMPFHLWLRQLARDRMIDAYRKHRVAERRRMDREQAAFPDQSSLDLAAQLHDHELTPAAAAIRRELEARFHNALEQLDEDDREILIMRYFEQMPNQDVARLLGLSEPAAGMRHLRALRRLRALLAESPSHVPPS